MAERQRMQTLRQENASLVNEVARLERLVMLLRSSRGGERGESHEEESVVVRRLSFNNFLLSKDVTRLTKAALSAKQEHGARCDYLRRVRCWSTGCIKFVRVPDSLSVPHNCLKWGPQWRLPLIKCCKGLTLPPPLSLYFSPPLCSGVRSGLNRPRACGASYFRRGQSKLLT
jgi:hypothetical protein